MFILILLLRDYCIHQRTDYQHTDRCTPSCIGRLALCRLWARCPRDACDFSALGFDDWYAARSVASVLWRGVSEWFRHKYIQVGTYHQLLHHVADISHQPIDHVQ